MHWVHILRVFHYLGPYYTPYIGINFYLRSRLYHISRSGGVSEAGTDRENLLLRSPLPVPPGGWGREPGTERAAATAAGIRRGLLRHVRGPPGSITQASSRGQCLPHLGAFVAYSGCEWTRGGARASSAMGQLGLNQAVPAGPYRVGPAKPPCALPPARCDVASASVRASPACP